jgi:hypothetical protein
MPRVGWYDPFLSKMGPSCLLPICYPWLSQWLSDTILSMAADFLNSLAAGTLPLKFREKNGKRESNMMFVR